MADRARKADENVTMAMIVTANLDVHALSKIDGRDVFLYIFVLAWHSEWASEIDLGYHILPQRTSTSDRRKISFYQEPM
jgi:hypothetical protein